MAGIDNPLAMMSIVGPSEKEKETEELLSSYLKMMNAIKKLVNEDKEVPLTYLDRLREIQNIRKTVLINRLSQITQIGHLKDFDHEFSQFAEEIGTKGLTAPPSYGGNSSLSPFPVAPMMRRAWLAKWMPKYSGKVIGYISTKGKEKLFYIHDTIGIRLNVDEKIMIANGSYKKVARAKIYQTDPNLKQASPSINHDRFVIAKPRRESVPFNVKSDLARFTQSAVQRNAGMPEVINKKFTGVEPPPLLLDADYIIATQYQSNNKRIPKQPLFDRMLLHLAFGLHHMHQQRFFHSDIKLDNVGSHDDYFFHADADEAILTGKMSEKEIAIALSKRKFGGRPGLLGSQSYFTFEDFKETHNRDTISFVEAHKRKDIAAMAALILELRLGYSKYRTMAILNLPHDIFSFSVIKPSHMLFTDEFCRILNLKPQLLELVKRMLHNDWRQRPNGSEVYEAVRSHYLAAYGKLDL